MKALKPDLIIGHIDGDGIWYLPKGSAGEELAGGNQIGIGDGPTHRVTFRLQQLAKAIGLEAPADPEKSWKDCRERSLSLKKDAPPQSRQKVAL